MAYGKRQIEVRGYRGQIPSPGRPTVAWRQDRVRFWVAIAAGAMTQDAAVEAGVSSPVAFRWFRHAGSVNPLLPETVSGRYLSANERESIALWPTQGAGVREIARRLKRATSTISRELRRNASTRTYRVDYEASVAQWHAERRARRPKTAKLVTNDRLRQYVQDKLFGVVRGADGQVVVVPSACRGRAAISLTPVIGPGFRRGVPSRSLADCHWISPMMRVCGSATRRSTRRSTSRPAVGSNGIWSAACAVAGRCGCRAHGSGQRRGRMSPRKR